jgi:hypothetical protein
MGYLPGVNASDSLKDTMLLTGQAVKGEACKRLDQSLQPDCLVDYVLWLILSNKTSFFAQLSNIVR